jgi:hypothetical protein
VGTSVLLVIAILLPTAVAGAMVGASRAWGWWRERRRRAAVTPVSIEELGRTLRRLHAQVEAIENQPPGPGKGLRVHAVRAAYADALGAACRRLNVAEPHLPATQTEIYRVEADLRSSGLDVRPVVPG